MLITRTEEYGVRLVLRMAREGGQLTVTRLAELENLPEPTVAKVLLQLRRGGIVRAERGRNGGYSLADEPRRLSVAQVLGALGEPLFAGRFCQSEVACACPNNAECSLRSVWSHIDTMIGKVLEGTSLQDLLGSEEDVGRHVLGLWPLEAAPAAANTDSGGRRSPAYEGENA